MKGKKRYLFWALIFLGLHNSCDLSRKKDYENMILEAIELEEKGDYVSALSIVDEAIRIRPLASNVYVLSGRLKINLDSITSGLKDFDYAILNNPKNTSAFFEKGFYYYNIQRDDSASIYFNRAIQTKKSGDLYFDFNDNQFLSFEDKTDVDMRTLRFYRGRSYFYLEKDAEAKADFEYCILMKYNVSESYTNLGEIELEKERYSNACIYLEKAKDMGDTLARRLHQEYCQAPD